MADELTILERLIGIAIATGTDKRPQSHAGTCDLEDAIAIAVAKNGGITPKAVSLIFRRKTTNPRPDSINAIKAAMRSNTVKKRFNSPFRERGVPIDWDTSTRPQFLSSLNLPSDTPLILPTPEPTLQPFHRTLREAYRASHRERIEGKYGGVYSVYRRHARKSRSAIVEDIMWLGFVQGADLPQALLLSEDGVMIGEVAPSEAAWSIQFISLQASDPDAIIENDVLRMVRRNGKAFAGLRSRCSQHGVNIGYRVILVQHPHAEVTIKDPNLDTFMESYGRFVCEHPEGSKVHELMLNLLEDDDGNPNNADRGVLHSNGGDLDTLKTFDPTDRPTPTGEG